MCIDAIKKYRKKGLSIIESIIAASNAVDYYAGKIDDARIHDIVKKGYKYYLITKDYPDNKITLDDKMWDVATTCIHNLKANRTIMSKLHPTDLFGEEIPVYNEDALFLNFNFIVNNEQSCVLKYKMKADSYSVDVDNKILTLNDLKTSGKNVDKFMDPEEGSYYHWGYQLQAGAYMYVLEKYAAQEWGYDPETWETHMNFLVVSTIPPYNTRCWYVTPKQVAQGKKEFENLMKMVAYYTINGYEEEVQFID